MHVARAAWPFVPRSHLLLFAAALLCAFEPVAGRAEAPAAAPEGTPTAVVIAGSLQSELGCAGDWNPACAATGLAFDANDGVWQRSFAAVPAGSYEYLGVLDNTWGEAYGQGGVLNGPNIPLALASPADVKFYYSDATHWVTDDVNSIIATVPGSFQTEIGCAGDWDPSCLRSWLQDLDGDGRYHWTVRNVPTGSYECLVAISESWDESYGQGGVLHGPNIPFTQPYADYQLDFDYDSVSHVLTVTATLFSDGFESHHLAAWSTSVP